MASEKVGGEIRSDSVYTLQGFMRRTGWERSATRTARRRGLKVRYSGGRGFVLGRDFHEYLLKNCVTESGLEKEEDPAE